MVDKHSKNIVKTRTYLVLAVLAILATLALLVPLVPLVPRALRVLLVLPSHGVCMRLAAAAMTRAALERLPVSTAGTTVPGTPNREFLFVLTFLETSSLENYHEIEVSKCSIFSKCSTHGCCMLIKH